jgi:hypothetical protein
MRRDQEYAEQQELARQEFERETERSRAERDKTRQEFDATLAICTVHLAPIAHQPFP